MKMKVETENCILHHLFRRHSVDNFAFYYFVNKKCRKIRTEARDHYTGLHPQAMEVRDKRNLDITTKLH